MIDRSPYGGLGTELIADIFLPFNFAAVGQDIRGILLFIILSLNIHMSGTCKSEGDFTLFHSDTSDGNQTVNWILEQPWCNGHIYQVGGSADGIAALELGLASPPSMDAQFIIFATGEAEEVSGLGLGFC